MAIKRPLVEVVDDIGANRQLVAAYLAGVDCDVVEAEDGEQALTVYEEHRPDLVLLDVRLPGLDGHEVCRRIKELPGGRLVPVVMITTLSQTGDRVLALEAGADDFMSKPVERVELVARVRSALRLKALYDTLESAERVIFSLATAVEAKDAYTERHTERVAATARRLGELLELPEADLDALYRGGMIHDIGKIGVSDAILLKPGPLNAGERRLMREHPLIGERIIRPLRSGADLLPIVRHHHERFDGRGYPDGLAGQEIPVSARVVAVCDSLDALTSDRPYRPGRSLEQSLDLLLRGAGTQWDPEIVDILVDHLRAQSRGAA
jgi:cyclic di-GMP phosphodiesterase